MPQPSPSPSLGLLLNDTARLLRRRFDQRARHLGLTRAQWNVIAMLFRNEGINQAGLADLLEVEPITLCRQIDRMEEAGWVERHPDPKDRRARLLRLTGKAHAILEQGRAVAAEVYAEALAGMPPDAEAQLGTLLGQMRNNLSDRRPAEAEGTERTATLS
ncbi:MarR family winged helix-turn-helix transcriptional regulator [Azospirillum doebereinerae]